MLSKHQFYNILRDKVCQPKFVSCVIFHNNLSSFMFSVGNLGSVVSHNVSKDYFINA